MGVNVRGFDIRNSGKTFKRYERIKKRRDFENLREKGKSLKSNNYVLIFTKNNFPYNRLAINVIKKIGNAAIRNYEKRICREIYRDIKNRLPAGFDFLIIVKKATGREAKKESENFTSAFSERKTELIGLFNRID